MVQLLYKSYKLFLDLLHQYYFHYIQYPSYKLRQVRDN